MRRTERTRRALMLLTVLIGGSIGAVVIAPSAGAATITSPTGNPFVVPGNASGQPQAFTVSASGYAANDQVFIEQCDGVAPTTIGWDPTQNCDLGTSPAAAIVSATGTVTFPSTDPNYAFKPFKGASPQGLFNCLSPTAPSPNNGLPDFTNCKLRVSTNNSLGTSDQVFLNLQLPNTVGSAPSFGGTPPGASTGHAYSFAFTGITGSPAPTFTMNPPSVAGSVTLSSAGVLSGTPTLAGTFPFTVTAANGVTPNAVRNLSLVVAPGGSAALDCGATGSLGFKPLSDVPPKKPKANKVKGSALLGTAASTTCEDHSAPGTTKFPVTSGSVKFKGALPVGSNCSSLATLPIAGTSLKIKWQGIKVKTNSLATAGKSLGTVSGVTSVDPGTYAVVGKVVSGAFTGKSFTLTLVTDKTHAARLAQCRVAGISTIGFTGLTGASDLAIG